MDERAIQLFRLEITTQCQFVLLAAQQLDDIPVRQQLELERAEQSMREAEAYRAAHPDDLVGYVDRLRARDEQRTDPWVDTTETWLAIQGILVSAANISKLLWGSGRKDDEKVIARRAARQPLRDLLQIDETSPLASKALRNDFEHFDERIEEWLRGNPGAHLGRNIVHEPEGTKFFGDEEPGQRFGHFDPVTGVVSFWLNEVPLRELVAEVTRILPLADPFAPPTT